MIGALKNQIRQIAKALVLPLLAQRFRRSMAAHQKPYLLHLGCGYNKLDGWVNIDFISTSAVDVSWNLGQPIPLADESCSFIFHEHVLEHFELERGLALLKECHRLLKKGGVLRVAMPCLDTMVTAYNDGNWEVKESAHMPEVKTGAEYMNVLFRNWGHQWIYNQAELERRLKEVGFQIMQRRQSGESDYHPLQSLECRIDSDLVVEAVK